MILEGFLEGETLTAVNTFSVRPYFIKRCRESSLIITKIETWNMKHEKHETSYWFIAKYILSTVLSRFTVETLLFLGAIPLPLHSSKLTCLCFCYEACWIVQFKHGGIDSRLRRDVWMFGRWIWCWCHLRGNLLEAVLEARVCVHVRNAWLENTLLIKQKHIHTPAR